MKKVQIWLLENGKETCVINDCMEENPLVLIRDLVKQDKLDGTYGGRYFIKRVVG